MTQYDPHSDLDWMRRIRSPTGRHLLGLSDRVDRVRNWIDEQQAEQAWNTDKPATQRKDEDCSGTVTGRFDGKNPPQSQRTSMAPLGARGEAVNNVSKLESMRPTVGELEERLFAQARTIIQCNNLLDTKDKQLAALQAGLRSMITLAESAERQMNDVRNKNTELELRIQSKTVTIPNMEERLKNQASTISSFERKSVEHDTHVDEAYKRGVREGKTEAREEFLHGARQSKKGKAFTTD